jgi:hypothetical protein
MWRTRTFNTNTCCRVSKLIMRLRRTIFTSLPCKPFMYVMDTAVAPFPCTLNLISTGLCRPLPRPSLSYLFILTSCIIADHVAFFLVPSSPPFPSCFLRYLPLSHCHIYFWLVSYLEDEGLVLSLYYTFVPLGYLSGETVFFSAVQMACNQYAYM